MKKFALISMLLAIAVSISHAARVPSEGYLGSPYQAESEEDDYFTFEYFQSEENNPSDFSIMADCPAPWGNIYGQYGCSYCALMAWESQENYESGACNSGWDIYASCQATLASSGKTCNDVYSGVGRSAIPLLLFTLLYIGWLILRKKKIHVVHGK